MLQGKLQKSLGRRGFLRRAGAFGAVLPVLGAGGIACSSDGKPTNTPQAHASEGVSGGAVSDAHAMTAEEMDAAHKKGVADFLKNQETPLTKGKGNVPLQPVMDGNVKVFNLTADEMPWEVLPGKTTTARGFNGMLPGPLLRGTEGDRVRIVVKNNLRESTGVHWHGLLVPNDMDGVPFVTQDPIKPGATFTYEFALRNAGTHMYHAHHNALDQVNRGLLGAFIVDPMDKSAYPQYDREYLMVLNDVTLGFTINGKGFPATEALTAKRGERVLIRWFNQGTMNHPMHLHGMPLQLFQKDGWSVNPPQLCDTLDVAPGNRYDTLIEATEPGVWAFHCHILTHAEGEQGMFGLVTALVVT